MRRTPSDNPTESPITMTSIFSVAVCPLLGEGKGEDEGEGEDECSVTGGSRQGIQKGVNLELAVSPLHLSNGEGLTICESF